MRDISGLISVITSTGGNDNKLRQNAQQSNLHIQQPKDAIAALDSQIESLETVPINDTSLYIDSKAQILARHEQHKGVLAEFDAAKQKAEHHIQSLKNELASIQQKCENKPFRVALLNSNQESLTNAQTEVCVQSPTVSNLNLSIDFGPDVIAEGVPTTEELFRPPIFSDKLEEAVLGIWPKRHPHSSPLKVDFDIRWEIPDYIRTFFLRFNSSETF
jgi:hypothetical protein